MGFFIRHHRNLRTRFPAPPASDRWNGSLQEVAEVVLTRANGGSQNVSPSVLVGVCVMRRIPGGREIVTCAFFTQRSTEANFDGNGAWELRSGRPIWGGITRRQRRNGSGRDLTHLANAPGPRCGTLLPPISGSYRMPCIPGTFDRPEETVSVFYDDRST